MQITNALGREIKDYVVGLLGRQPIVTDKEGVILSTSDDNFVGTKLFSNSNRPNQESQSELTIDNKKYLFIPLQSDRTTVGFLTLEAENISEIETSIPLLKSFAELLIQQYGQVNQPTLDSTDQFVIKLLNNASTNDLPFYESEAKVLGYNLSAKRIAIVIHLGGFWENCLLSLDQPSFERDEVIKNYKRNIETAINGFFSKSNDVIVAYVGNDKFAVFKAVTKEDEQNISKFLKNSYKAIFEPLKNCRITDFAVGFSNAYSGILGLINGYREADLAIELGQKIWGQDKSYYFGDLGIMSIIGQGDKEKNLEFANQLLYRISKNDDLNKTLDCFFDHNLNLTETAEKLGVHRNTIIYRLNQISKILGSDPRVFEQAMTIKIALLIKKLFVQS